MVIGSKIESHGDIEVSGFMENAALLERLLMKNYNNEKKVRTMVRKALKKARNDISRDIHNNIGSDPRGAYRAVKMSVYKQLLGGNISILQKRKRGAPTSYQKPRTLRPGQRGGNRITPSERTRQLESYGGADRGFILRFLNAGTDGRTTRFGNRGGISSKGVFANSAPWHMESAARNLVGMIDEMIKQEING